MATAPKINYFDGSGTTTELVVTSNLFGFSITGTVDPNTIDVQVDFNGAGFVSDPTLIGISLPKFAFPNPESFPSGINLDKGLNTIRFRAIDITGSVSPISIVKINVVSDNDLQQILSPPTGVSLKRRSNSVDINWSDVSVGSATGFNVYASTGPGGTGSGYLRINSEIIPSDSKKETVQSSFSIGAVDYNFEDDPNNELKITIDVVDSVNGVLISRKAQNFFPLVSSSKYKVSLNVESVDETNNYVYNHNRDSSLGNGTLNNDVFGAVVPEDALYYVVSSVYFDKTNGILQESRFSNELSGAPLPLDTSIRGINIRDQKQVSQDYISQINKKDPTLSLIPGSSVREVHIEPFSNEIQKVYFLMDFVHRAKSFAALLAIDDPGYTGQSVPVSSSQYKQNLKTALSTSDDASVQSLIDSAFSALAENFGVVRQGPRLAQVLQTFYTKTRPTKDLIIQQGALVSSSTNANAPRFLSKSQAVMVAANAQSYYNTDKKRYEIIVQLIADIPGSIGIVSAGELDVVSSGATGLSTINDVSSVGGLDTQSNLELSEVAQSKLYSLDTGTDGGYNLSSIGTDGVFDSRIISSGDPMMMRDYDDVRQKHIGGKVDIWLKGTIERTIVETFAFQFDTARRIRFDVIDATNLVFRARDSRLTISNPIQQMLYNPSQSLGLFNFSNLPSTSYDLTGVSIIDYNTIRLNTLIPQPPTLLDDFIEGDYRYRSNNKFTASVQPVRRVVSVIGEISGPLDTATGFTLYKTQDPLLEGESTIAKDYMSINQVGDVPNGESVLVNDETHVLIGEFEELLDSVGINLFTVQVFSSDRSITYNGPNSSDPDYLIVGGSQTEPIRIVRTSSSTIPTGATVSVDYEHDENFVVSYVVNDVLQTLQRKINATKHTTADVLVKQAIENPLSTEMTVVLLRNADKSATDSSIRSSVTVLTDSKKTGEPVYQSDMTSVVEQSNGVDYIVQPFSKMTLRDGSQRLRDQVLSDYVFLQSLSLSVNAVYLLIQELPFNTSDGGGPSNVHKGVYKDDLIMEPATSLEDVGTGLNKYWIIGKNGAIIPGYTDDATLFPLFITQEAVTKERLERTSNRVVVSLDFGSTPQDLPTDHKFSATYIVSGDVGSKDITTSRLEYITPGDLTITYKIPN